MKYQKHLCQLKSKKASNDVNHELLKICEHPFMRQVIHKMTNNLWSNLDIPAVWGWFKTWKGNGSKLDPSKYRRLNIGSTLCKLIINISLERIRPWYEAQLSKEQNGFRRNHGTTDAIYSIKRIHQISNRKKQPFYNNLSTHLASDGLCMTYECHRNGPYRREYHYHSRSKGGVNKTYLYNKFYFKIGTEWKAFLLFLYFYHN